MEKLDNPFPVVAYHGEEYFCDRETESGKILDALKNGRNITVTALRRMGKTGLIHHVFHQLKNKKGTRCFYIDLYPTNSQADLIKILARQTLGKLDSNPVKLMRELGNFFSHLRPVIQYDPMSGAPSVEFTIDANFQPEHTLDQLFSYLEKQPGQIIIAFDEFQQIIEYPEKNTEALLRSFIQKSKNQRYIFSGSHTSMLEAMFNHQNRPFYQSTDMMHLDSIDHDLYKKFIIEKFADGKRKITEVLADRILDWTRHHTYYVQLVCNRLYSKGIRLPDEWYLERVMAEMLEENAALYYNYRKLLTENQWLLLKAIAKENGARQILSLEFLRKHHLGSTSSMQTALAALIDKEMIFEAEGNYFVYDVLLSRWLEFN
ncbi:ATP-binding protein [soil metagenome]